jgi:hypothetical protein
MPYGITYGQTPQLDSSSLQHTTGALIPQHMTGSGANVYTGSESNGSPNAVSTTALQTTSQAATATSSLFRNDDKRLTREAMEKYLRNRNDMIIVILHAKVITYFVVCHTLFKLPSTCNVCIAYSYNCHIIYIYLGKWKSFIIFSYFIYTLFSFYYFISWLKHTTIVKVPMLLIFQLIFMFFFFNYQQTGIISEIHFNLSLCVCVLVYFISIHKMK